MSRVRILPAPPNRSARPCEVPAPPSHFGSGTCVPLPGPAPAPGRHWLRHLCLTRSTSCSSLIFTCAQPGQGDVGMLQELSVVEQRYLAVREVLDGTKVTDVATRYRVDRRTVHRWLVRYANEGLGALADRSSRPDRCPHQTPPEVEAQIVPCAGPTPTGSPHDLVEATPRARGAALTPAGIWQRMMPGWIVEPRPRDLHGPRPEARSCAGSTRGDR